MRYVLYLSGQRPIDDHRRIYTPIFEDIGMARSFIETFMGPEPIIPVNNTLEFGTFKLRCSKLTEILEADLVVLPSHYAKSILQFKYGFWEKPVERSTEGGDTPAQRTPKAERERRPGVPPGYMRITELATTWGIPALQARAALRASDRVKPPYGWAFDPKEVPALKKLCGVL